VTFCSCISFYLVNFHTTYSPLFCYYIMIQSTRKRFQRNRQARLLQEISTRQSRKLLFGSRLTEADRKRIWHQLREESRIFFSISHSFPKPSKPVAKPTPQPMPTPEPTPQPMPTSEPTPQPMPTPEPTPL